MSFDHLAPCYRWLEFVLAGGLLQECRLAWLRQARGATHALLAGEGNGRFLSACATALPGTRFTVMDASAGMLGQAQAAWRRRGGPAAQATFVQATLPGARLPAEAFDLVVTHFFLDCFPAEELGGVIRELAGAATPTARWLLADFAVPARGWARARAQGVLALAYAFFRVVTGLRARRLVVPDEGLRGAGFTLRGRQVINWGLLHSDWWERGA